MVKDVADATDMRGFRLAGKYSHLLVVVVVVVTVRGFEPKKLDGYLRLKSP
jgi:hypothetical protein